MELKNKKLLITGGASGIGKIMARKSLERGISHLVIWDINEEGLSKTKEEFSKFGIPISVYKVDVSNLDEIKINAQKVRTEVGKIDVLINNAGIVVGKYFHENTHQDIQKTMLINSNALMHVTLEFLPEMMKENSGAICNIASSAGLILNPKKAVYSASKWAGNRLSRSLRLEIEEL